MSNLRKAEVFVHEEATEVMSTRQRLRQDMLSIFKNRPKTYGSGEGLQNYPPVLQRYFRVGRNNTPLDITDLHENDVFTNDSVSNLVHDNVSKHTLSQEPWKEKVLPWLANVRAVSSKTHFHNTESPDDFWNLVENAVIPDEFQRIPPPGTRNNVIPPKVSSETSQIRQAYNEAQKKGSISLQKLMDAKGIPRQQRVQMTSVSLLEEIKQQVHYDNIVFPAVTKSRQTPAENPNTVCFSLPVSDECPTHAFVKRWIEAESEVKVVSMRFDAVSNRARLAPCGHPASRWMVTLSSQKECLYLAKTGLNMDGRRIIVEQLNDVTRCSEQPSADKMKAEKKNTNTRRPTNAKIVNVRNQLKRRGERNTELRGRR